MRNRRKSKALGYLELVLTKRENEKLNETVLRSAVQGCAEEFGSSTIVFLHTT